MSGNVDLLNVLLQNRNGLNGDFTFSTLYPNDVDIDGCSAVIHAAKHGHWQLIPALAIQGANLTVTDNDGWSALHFASDAAEDATVLSLIDCKADVDQLDDRGWTSLMMAVSQGNHTTAGILVDAGADTSIVNFYGVTALNMATKTCQAAAEYILDGSRQADAGQSKLPSLATLKCDGQLTITVIKCNELWLEKIDADKMNVYCVIQMIQDETVLHVDHTMTTCSMGSADPLWCETFRLDLPYVGPTTRVGIHVFGSLGSKDEIRQRMGDNLGSEAKLSKMQQAAQDMKNAMLKRFQTTQVAATKKKMKVAVVDEGETARPLSLADRRCRWVGTLWRNAGMAKVAMPPVPREDFHLGFLVVQPSLIRDCVSNCETGQPVRMCRTLKGSTRGDMTFEIDYRRKWRPGVVVDPSDNQPDPAAESFLNAPQPPLIRHPKVPTTPWGMIPEAPLHSPEQLRYGDESTLLG
jgi:hypothetical protein